MIDEPTTGMDSFTSLVIIKYLKNMANSGKTVICTIHQPSSEIFQYVDRIILLKDGHLIYQGKSELALKYFDVIGHPMPEFCNPFDFFLGILSDDNISANALNKNYLKLCEDEIKDEQVKSHEKYKSEFLTSIKNHSRQISWISEYVLLLKRTFINYVRNKSLFIARVINCILNTLIIMGFYWQIGDMTEPDRYNNLQKNYVGFFFNNINQFFINGIFTSVFMIPTIKPVLKRESAAKLYRISTFYTSLCTTMLINSLIYAVIFSPITYFSIDFMTGDPVVDFWVLTNYFILNFSYFTLGQFLGLMIGGWLNEQATFVATPFVFIVFMLGSGFYRGNSTIPKFISWFLYISPYKYMLELLLKNFDDFNDITKKIPENMNFNIGVEECISILVSFGVIVLIFGYIGIKYKSSKF